MVRAATDEKGVFLGLFKDPAVTGDGNWNLVVTTP